MVKYMKWVKGTCANCGAAAAWQLLSPNGNLELCSRCALILAGIAWDHMNDGQKLYVAGFKPLEDGGKS